MDSPLPVNTDFRLYILNFTVLLPPPSRSVVPSGPAAYSIAPLLEGKPSDLGGAAANFLSGRSPSPKAGRSGVPTVGRRSSVSV